MKNEMDYLDSLSDQDKAYRENLAPGDRALYDYFGNMPAKLKDQAGTFKLDSAIGPELTVGDCTPELWAKIGHTG
ncbi:hypothetical protein MTO98_07545 [Mucilaginibacter sp. SMC90]|uniref:hypothetical protein n=1 Tax=Mucilaginibacter sp. SMC90 TaxID=2929803 RepID=UPI001FB2B9D1|nr:hypothetical protein [Mucilaginibacter sp. SMC90]UOE50930.1 hypothetical protein MTO98_07545 [Mucilaginibacter sp. SMC90]